MVFCLWCLNTIFFSRSFVRSFAFAFDINCPCVCVCECFFCVCCCIEWDVLLFAYAEVDWIRFIQEIVQVLC